MFGFLLLLSTKCPVPPEARLAPWAPQCGICRDLGMEPSCVAHITGSPLTRLGADLLKMSRDDLVQICGPADGIRLFNAIKGRWVSVQLAAGVAEADNGVLWASAGERR